MPRLFSAKIHTPDIDECSGLWYNDQNYTLLGERIMAERKNNEKRPLNLGLLAHVWASRCVPLE